MSKPIPKLIALIACILIIQGCSNKPRSLYYWGQYEPMIYDIYLNPGKADVETQILTLSELIERAQTYNMKVPPGIYAHLGMAHAQSGNPAAALDAFNTEKMLYPESTVFLDGIIERSNLQASVPESASSVSSLSDSSLSDNVSSDHPSSGSSSSASSLSSIKTTKVKQ